MQPRQVAIYLGGGALLFAGVALVAGPLTRRVEQVGSGISATAAQLTAEPDSIPDAAVQQRFRLRRAAVASMRADLLKIVEGEARFKADYGRYEGSLAPPYWPTLAPGNTPGAIWLTPHGWWATISNLNVSIACAVAVGGDTTIGDAPQGQPVCFDGGPLGPAPTTREQCVARYYFHWDQEHGVCRRATL